MTKSLSPEYKSYVESDAWRKRRKSALIAFCNRDCLLPWLRANEVDHISYRNMGREIVFRDILPLNGHTHRFITWLRAVCKGKKRRITTAQRCLAWAMRFIAALWLVPIWAIALANAVIRKSRRRR